MPTRKGIAKIDTKIGPTLKVGVGRPWPLIIYTELP